MLDIKFIKENPDKIKQGCKKKQVDVDIDLLLDLDKKRIEILQKVEGIRAQKNQSSKIIPKTKDKKEREKIIAEMRKLDKKSDELEKKLKEIEAKPKNSLPNS